MPRCHVSRLALAVLSCAVLAPAQEVVRTFAMRLGARTIGSVVETEAPTTIDGRPAVQFTSRTVAQVELLGAAVDQRIEQTWWLEPGTRTVLRLQASAVTGSQKVEVSGRLVDGAFRLDGGGAPLDPARVVIAPDLRWLVQRGPKLPGERLELDCLLPELGGVQKVTVAFAADPERQLDVLGVQTPVRAYAFGIVALGVEATMFVTRDGELVRYEIPAQQLVVERAPPDAVTRLERVDMTNLLLVRTNLDLDDPSPLTYVRLRATIETGSAITAAGLNVPGQSFEGTVDQGRVQGVFEIRSRRSDGAGSLPFPPPPDAFTAAWLQPYLQPEPGLIESDDAGIAAEARRLAAGSKTCFEVVERLARWTHREIPYAIPGGGSARGTFVARQGECGGHSRLLAAMLRSLGIPARTPMGGMYVPRDGGSFGQHMWNEVWLGEAIGWLAVDCTAGQYTFVDATHIRLAGEATTFRPLAIEVLEHAPKATAAAAAATVQRRSDAYPFSVGTPLVYAWSQNGVQLGDERVTWSTTPTGAHVVASSLSLASGAFQETTRTEVGADGRLLAFHAERIEGPQQSTIDVTLADGKAICVRQSLEGERNDTVTVDPSVFVLHNNCMPHFLLPVCRHWPLPDGAEVRVRMFHTEQRSVFMLTLRGSGTETIKLGGEQVTARVVRAELAGLSITLHVDDEGRLLRYHQQQGAVTVELQRS
jgi:transglutaminase-like putative cysteine protease